MQIDKIDIQTAVSNIMKANNILILFHKNPDGDAIGSSCALMHALKNVGKTCAVLCADEIPSIYVDYMNIEEFKGQFEPEYIICVDTASAQRLGDLPKEILSNIDMCIDHHPSNTNFAPLTLVQEDAAACAEIVYELITSFEQDISPLIADCLYTGVSTDTGCFRFSNTSANSHAVAQKLIEAGARHNELNVLFFQSKSKARIELERTVYRSLEFFEDDKCVLICLTLEQIEQCNAKPIDLEGITAIPKSIQGVKAGITLRQITPDTYKVSVRSSSDLNASDICKAFGGGGHAQAAGCEIIGSYENVKNAVINEVKAALANI